PGYGLAWQGNQVGSRFGNAVAGGHDLNGDHIADLVIGGSGGAVVVFGSASTFAPGSRLDLATQAPGHGVVIQDDAALFSALLVANAGDVNLDGNNDLLIGSPAAVDAQNQPIAGKSYVLFGGPGFAGGANAITLSSLEQGVGVYGFVVEGAGSEVAGAGDLNGDGAADLLLSEPQANGQAGISYVIYGGNANHIGTVATLNVADIGTSVQGYTIGGAAADSLSGAAASAAGDLNGDGCADLLLGAPDSPSQTALNNLQDALQSQYIIAPSAANPQFSAAAPLPYTNRANPSLEELILTSTSQGILATWVDTSSGAPALMAAFWTIGGGWQRTPATITTGTADTSISDIEVAGSGKTVILSWVQNDNSTSTASHGQSTFTKNLWTPAIVTTDSNVQPPATIDNIIQNPNVGRSSDGSNRYAISHRSVNETDGVVVFTVMRSGDLSRPTMLRYRTEDGSATAGADYEHSEGLLPFAPSESEKSVTIKLVNDALNEYRSESFKLKLSDGEGLALEARATLQDSSPINLLAIDSGFQMKGPGAAMLGAALAPGGPIGQSSSTGQPLDSLWIAAPADDGGGGVLYLLRGQSGAEAVDTGLNLDAPGPNTTVIAVTRPSNAASATPQTGAHITSWQNATTTWTAVSAPNASGQGGQNDSQIFLFDSSAVAGGSSRSIAIDSLATHPIRGNSADGFGAAVALADLDGDGTPELLVSAPLAGKVFVYKLSGSGTAISAGQPVATISAPGPVGLGSALSVLDLNGDHHLDIAIGASLYAPLHDSSGAVLGYGGGVYVLAGNGQMPGNTTLPASATYQGQATLTATQVSGKLNPSSGATRNNPNPSPDTPFTESIGDALASVDLNGDGISDLVIGAPSAAVNGVSNLGKAYVVFGGSTALSTKLASLSAGQGLVLEGVLANGQAGSAVANAGDVNNDQIDDLLVGAPLAYGNAGSAYLLFGSRNAYSQAAGITTISLDPNLEDSRIFQYQGIANPLSNTTIFNPGSVGYALGGIGDINGDYSKGTSGGDDILLGAPSANDGTGNGQAYVAIGHPWLRGGLALSVHDLRGDNGFILPNGKPATAVGDVNGDGFADILTLGGGSTFNQPLGNLLTLGADTLSELNGPRTFNLASRAFGYQLSLQANGDLVIVDTTGIQVWSTGTANSGATYAIVQGDGNVVLYTAAGDAVWASNTPGHPGAVLSLAPDGGLWVTTGAGLPLKQLTGDGEVALLNQAQVLLSAHQQLTASGTAVLSTLQSTAATYQLSFAGDGSLIYAVAGGNRLWQSAVPTAPAGWGVMPSTARALIDDASGNLFLLYQILSDNYAEIDTRTLPITSAGVPGSSLVITAGGGLYLLSPQGQVLETLAGGAYDPSLPKTTAPSTFNTPVTLSTTVLTGSELVLQANGNLILNQSSTSGTSTLWQSGSSGSGGTTATMQNDGNFVLYTAAGQAVWASNTNNAPGASLHLAANGALTLQNSSGQVIETLNPGQPGTWPPSQAILATNQQLTTAATSSAGVAVWPETT
ncbi:MAG: Calx-beta domain-containing protein, partial [Cyanobacteriota bacterium]